MPTDPLRARRSSICTDLLGQCLTVQNFGPLPGLGGPSEITQHNTTEVGEQSTSATTQQRHTRQKVQKIAKRYTEKFPERTQRKDQET
jgi:hypothetical protein